jgi:hypothetical protein
MGVAHWLKLPRVPLLVLSGIGLSALGLVSDGALFQDALLYWDWPSWSSAPAPR